MSHTGVRSTTSQRQAIGPVAALREPAGAVDRRRQALFMRACRCEVVERTPVWLMRQAGRYLPEYRAVREKVGFMELCKNPRLSAEVMIATVHRLGVDAAIIFSDLLPLLEPMGFDLEFAAGEGPVIHNPVREPQDLARVAVTVSMTKPMRSTSCSSRTRARSCGSRRR